MEEEDKQETEETGTTTPEGTKDDGTESEATKVLKIQSERIKKLEKEAEDRAAADAKKEMGGRAEAGGEPVKPKEETPKEYNDRIEKELSEGKHNE
ncbi:hypothetical protein LCGC14_1204260 [marine sediment metagenome]|uniref:Uncharacterized protein n=1 Tax=marine sediment metagenome TaxID=412755 RepID=A0A0F9M3E0_9ZZZZ